METAINPKPRRSRKRAKKLYHYCSPNGLMRIVNENALSATHASFFNDRLEVTYAVQLLDQVLDRCLLSDMDIVHRTFYEDLRTQVKFIKGLNVFVFCFSEEKDLLSQWRAYCPQTGGFSIGFEKSDLEELAGTYNFELQPCIYKETHQIRAIEELLKSALNNLDTRTDGVITELEEEAYIDEALIYKSGEMKWSHGSVNELFSLLEANNAMYVSSFAMMAKDRQLSPSILSSEEMVGEIVSYDMKALPTESTEGVEKVYEAEVEEINRNIRLLISIFTAFLYHFVRLAPTLKHPGFAEEKEWRLISAPQPELDDHVDFRSVPTSSILVPFFKLKYPKDTNKFALAEVIVGPTTDMERSIFTLKWYLKAKNMEPPIIAASLIPYRIN